jgi:hypothetical protein
MTLPGTAGSLLTAPYQYELGNGADAWLWGSGTPNQVEEVQGLQDMPDMTDNDLDRQDDHGSFYGIDLLKKRRLLFSVNLLHDDTVGFTLPVRQQELETRINLVSRWLQPVTADLILVFRRNLATAPYYVDKYCIVRPKKRALPSNADLASGLGKLKFELHAADPRIYRLAATTAVINTTSGVMTGNTILHPLGETSSYPVYTITGPASNPVIANSDDSNRQIKINHVMSGGDTLVIDTLAKSVTLNGVQHWDFIASDSLWHRLHPQIDNHITYSQGNAAATSCAISYRDAWI